MALDLALDGAGRARHRRHARRRSRHRRRCCAAPARRSSCAGARHRTDAGRTSCRATSAMPTRWRALRRRDRATGTAGWTSSSTTPAARRTHRPPTRARSFHAKVVELNLLAPLLVAQAANEVMQQPGRRRRDRDGQQRQRAPALARHRGLRRREGRSGQPHREPRRRVGAAGAGELGRRRDGAHRAGAAALRRRRRDRCRRRDRSAGPAGRAGGDRRLRRVPRLAAGVLRERGDADRARRGRGCPRSWPRPTRGSIR